MLLYLHIPFCDSRCHYCAFNSYVDKIDLKREYLSSIIEQLKYEIERFSVKKESIETLFIGGGTPSVIEPKLYEPFFYLIKPYLKIDAEITVEANPNSANSTWQKDMRDLGVNRISFGVQSFSDEKLRILGRNHSSKMAIKAIESAKKIGFNSISIDLIYSLAYDSKNVLLKDLNSALSLDIKHISAYSLTIERDTLFFNRDNIKDDNETLTYWFIEKIKSSNLEQYEISNFGKERSKHNLGYWEYKDYIGVGSGAVGFLKDRRFYTKSDINSYINNPLDIEIEILNHDSIKSEKVLLGARSIVGFSKSILNPSEIKRAEILVDEGKLIYKNSHFYNKNYLLSDEIALYILD